MIGALIAVGSYIIYDLIPPKKETFKESYPLVALQDNINLNGHFFLGCGSIENNNYYFVMLKDKERIKFHKLPAEKWNIIEEENIQPQVVVIKKSVPKLVNELFSNDDDDLGVRKGKIIDRIIYIPKNSIINNYKIDLNNKGN